MPPVSTEPDTFTIQRGFLDLGPKELQAADRHALARQPVLVDRLGVRELLANVLACRLQLLFQDLDRLPLDLDALDLAQLEIGAQEDFELLLPILSRFGTRFGEVDARLRGGP